MVLIEYWGKEELLTDDICLAKSLENLINLTKY